MAGGAAAHHQRQQLPRSSQRHQQPLGRWAAAAACTALVLLAAAAMTSAAAQAATGADHTKSLAAGDGTAWDVQPAVSFAAVQAVVAPAAVQAPEALDRTGWTITADSAETVAKSNPAAAAIDGNSSTFWHSAYSGDAPAPLPHRLVIDVKRLSAVTALTYLPRQDKPNGRIGRFSLQLSTNGQTYDEVASGTLADDFTLKQIDFQRTSARYVRLIAVTEAGNRGPWSSAGEINMLGGPNPSLPRDAWVVTVDSEETSPDANNLAAIAVDGNVSSFWHTAWVGNLADLPPHPHTFTIDTGDTRKITSLSYLPRPPPKQNGNIGDYRCVFVILL